MFYVSLVAETSYISFKYYSMEEEYRSERKKSETLGGKESPAYSASRKRAKREAEATVVKIGGEDDQQNRWRKWFVKELVPLR